MEHAVEIKAQRIVPAQGLSGTEALAISAAIILVFAYIAGLMARLHWGFDLFSHFVLQYMIAGLLLAFILGIYGQWVGACACFLIFSLSLYQLNPRPFMAYAAIMPGTQQIQVVQYNRFHHNADPAAFGDWLRRQQRPPDIVIMQEVPKAAYDDFATLTTLYPHRFPEQAQDNTRVYILSRYPITQARMINTATAEQGGGFGLHADIKIAENLPTVSVYSLHAHRPVDAAGQKRRNHELEKMAAAINESKSPYKIFAGDWNITPYSPHFHDLLEVAQLNHTYFGLSAPGTWPSFAWPPFLRLPIDHILHSEGLKLNMLETAPSSGSDHIPVAATFTLRNAPARILE